MAEPSETSLKVTSDSERLAHVLRASLTRGPTSCPLTFRSLSGLTVTGIEPHLTGNPLEVTFRGPIANTESGNITNRSPSHSVTLFIIPPELRQFYGPKTQSLDKRDFHH